MCDQLAFGVIQCHDNRYTVHEHCALCSTCLSSAWQRALGPQVATEQGSTHWLAMQDCVEGQSVCSLQPTRHILLRQTWPRKQSLSTRHVSMHCPLLQRSLAAHSLSEPQRSMQMPSWQPIPLAGQATSLTQVVGMRTHSTSELPVNWGGHEQSFLWPAVEHSALTPHALGSEHGSRHRPAVQISLVLQLPSV